MMEKSYFCLWIMLCTGHVSSNNHDDPSRKSEEDKHTDLLFRLAQDMGSALTDMKTLIMLQSREMA